MKSGVGFLAFRLCRWASVLLIILLSLLVVSCDLWNKDMLGYLKYWSETVQLGKVEVSDATIQKNDAGADTIPVAATPTIAVYVVNPQGYGLLAEIGDSSSADKSVRVSDSVVQSKAQVVAHEPTLLKVQLGSADGSLEHTEFRVDFEAIRKDTMQSSGKVMGVTLRYNTPPVAPTPVVWSYDSSQHEVVKDGETWEADRGGILYWAYDDSITEETDPNCAKWFSINGTRHPVAECKVPDVQVDGLSVFQFKTNYGSTSVAAVDSEGISSPAIASGQAVPPATYVIKYDANGADGGTAPTSQSKTQYTDITLATNSGGLTRIGYRFTGWNTDPDGVGTTYSAGAAYSADESVTLYAQWEAVDAVVLTPESGAVNHGATVTLTPPTRDATIYYQIGGASETKGNPGQSVTVTLHNANKLPQNTNGVAAGIPEGGNVTITTHAVYADGTKSEVTTGDYSLNQYTVSYEGNGNGDVVGNVPDPQTFYSGGSVAIGGGANRPERIGYRFTGWNTTPDGAGTTYPADATYSADERVTLYAQWEAVDAVTFSRDGAVNSGDTVQLTPPKAEVTIYYSTDGGQNWQQGQLNQSVTINLYNEKSMPQSQTGVDVGIPEGDSVTITAYAKYADGTPSKETTGTYTLKQYTVSYNGNNHTGGTVPSRQTFYSGGPVAIGGGVNRPERIGYRFTVWNSTRDGAGTTYSAGATYSADESVTLYAQWDPNTYYVSFDSNGGSGSMDDQQFTYNTAKNLTKNTFTRTGHTFVGWATSSTGSVVYPDGSSILNLTAVNGGMVSLYAIWGNSVTDFTNLQNLVNSAASSGDPVTIVLTGDLTFTNATSNTYALTIPDGANVTLQGDGQKRIIKGSSTGWIEVSEGILTLGPNLVIDGDNASSHWGAISVKYRGTLIMEDGAEIINMTSGGSTCSAVHLTKGNSAYGGTFIMNGGRIENNYGAGAAVAVGGGSTFIMNGGQIVGNTTYSTVDSGGVNVDQGGEFTMNGGTITGNYKDGSTKTPSDVTVESGGTFVQNGGTIGQPVETIP